MRELLSRITAAIPVLEPRDRSEPLGWRSLAAGALAAWCAGTSSVAAQGLSGTVVDGTHAGIPRVTVTLEDLERQVTRRVVTDGQGRFAATDLPAGTYVVEAVAPGFAPSLERVTVGSVAVEREVLLEPAPVAETITVSADGVPRAGDIRTRGPAEPCTPPVDSQTLSPVGGQLRPPRMLAHPQPTFPNHLRNALVDGTVRMVGRIGTDGRLVDPVIESGHPDLAAAVEDTVREWTWQEALLNCEPVEIGVTISVTFLLPNPPANTQQ